MSASNSGSGRSADEHRLRLLRVELVLNVGPRLLLHLDLRRVGRPGTARRANAGAFLHVPPAGTADVLRWHGVSGVGRRGGGEPLAFALGEHRRSTLTTLRFWAWGLASGPQTCSPSRTTSGGSAPRSLTMDISSTRGQCRAGRRRVHARAGPIR